MMTENYTGKVAATVIPKTEKKEKFLIAKRSDNGDWEFPGGKQHMDETLLKTAEREIMEELGLNINSKKAVEKHSYRSGGYEIIPVMAEIRREEFELELVDHAVYRWIRPEKIENMEIELENEIKCLEAFDLL